MSVLTVIRHGQASFLQDDYDKLSPLGERQARLLGDYWARHELQVDAIYTGPLLRQRRTAEIAVETLRCLKMTPPDPVVLEELAEHQGHEVMTQYLPRLTAADERVRSLENAFLRAEGVQEKARTFQKVFEEVMLRWVRGELSAPEYEAWPAFVTRVRNGIAAITGNASNGQRIAAFTSGGPTGVAMQYALDLTPEATLNLTWMVRNAAVTEFLFTEDRFTVSSFNAFPHLDSQELWTYR